METDPARDIEEKNGVTLMYWFGKRPYGNRIKSRNALGRLPFEGEEGGMDRK